MQEAVSLRFAETVRRLAGATRAAGLAMPSFRSPPGIVGVARTLRRRPDGSAVVAVLLHGRLWSVVAADMVEGVVAANSLDGVEAERCRRRLHEALADPPRSGTGGCHAVAA